MKLTPLIAPLLLAALAQAQPLTMPRGGWNFARDAVRAASGRGLLAEPHARGGASAANARAGRFLPEQYQRIVAGH